MSNTVFENSAVRATVDIDSDHVAVVELITPPNNFFSLELIGGVADALQALDADDHCRAILLCADGKHFCAGADFSADASGYTTEELYAAAARIVDNTKPVVAAIQGAAIGGGLGLALTADFRFAAPEARFSANFARLGFHHGFGLSVTLPRLVGPQSAAELLYTGRRVKGGEAAALGLADRVVPLNELRAQARSFAGGDCQVCATCSAFDTRNAARRPGRSGQSCHGARGRLSKSGFARLRTSPREPERWPSDASRSSEAREASGRCRPVTQVSSPAN